METLWNFCLEKLREEVSPQTFDRWFAETREVSRDDKTVTVEARDSFTIDTLRTRYWGIISQILDQESGNRIALRFVTRNGDGAPEQASPLAAPSPPPRQAVSKPDFLNPRYKFDNFVVGNSNQLAHACCRRVAENPGLTMNPLFIYGGVGLGKTHLLHAIGHQILETRPASRIYFTTSENFINELIASLRRNRMSEFRSKYRRMDTLIIDDIQFFARKERTQEEFFFTFNALHEAGNQIVITSDRVPKDTAGLEERLRTRFVWGMMADIGVPDFETRVAILQRKAVEQNQSLPVDVAHFIASKVKSNIRELEGCLVKLTFHASLHGTEIDMPMTQEVLRQIIWDPSRLTGIDTIQQTVSSHFQVKVSDLRSKNRSQIYALPRQISMFLCREMTRASTTEIGRRFGGKDHTTVIHSTNKIKDLIQKDPSIASTVQRLRDIIEVS